MISRLKSVTVVAIALLLPQSAHGLVSTVTNPVPIAVGSFTDGAGDQVSALASSSQEIYAAGTVEGANTDWIRQDPLGGSDGFICAFTLTGKLDWSLRLGGTGDEIATAATVSAGGDIWIAGVSAPHSELTELTVWQVSAAGTLMNTFHTAAPGIIYPHAITESKSNLLIRGMDFSVTLSKLGAFSSFKTFNYVNPAQLVKFVGSKYSWNIYTGRGPVLGVPTFKPKKVATLYYKYLNSTKSVRAAYSIPEKPLLVRYQKDVGVILLTERESGFAFFLLK